MNGPALAARSLAVALRGSPCGRAPRGDGSKIEQVDRMRPLLRLHGLVTDLGYLAAALGLASMGALYCMEVVFRYFLNAPTRWSLELITYLMLIVTFLAVPHAVRGGMHIAVTLLADLYPKHARRILSAMNGIGAILCGFIAYISLLENIAQYQGSIETIGNIPIPKWWLSIFITYGFFNSALWYLRLLFHRSAPIAPELKLLPRPGGGPLS
jgi:C4-dicarboxylate transporter, DctQ subunit